MRRGIFGGLGLVIIVAIGIALYLSVFIVDQTQQALVLRFGETVRKNLFGSSDPIGQVIRIKSIPFRVVGLLASKGQSAAMGDDQDDRRPFLSGRS